MQKFYIYEYLRRLCDEDDELSEVEPDAVPSEVRDWLALTFTRSMSNIKRRGEEKPKFRTVAHAIRAGIMVDRIYRRMSSSVGLHVPPNVLLLLKNLDDWSFDVFSVNEAGDNHALKFVTYELLQRYDLIAKFKISTQVLESFLAQLESGYSKYTNPYHNLIHAADIAQTVHHILSQSSLAHWLTDLEVFATIIAACVHDFEHTGTTNNYHINTNSSVALLYNDKAVLENHHISAAFRLMREDEHNILSGLKPEEYREFRSLVIDMVLATDMSYHFQQIKNMKNMLSMPENIDKSKALSLVLHCADISHPAKDWELHVRWTERLLEEFFRQGDHEAELGLPYSPLCDRKNTLVAESQIGFIDFIVDPSFQVMGDMLEKILTPYSSTSRLHDGSITEEKTAEKTTSTASSARSSRSSSPRSRTPVTGIAPPRVDFSNHLYSVAHLRIGGFQYVADLGTIAGNLFRKVNVDMISVIFVCRMRFEVRRQWVECLTKNKSYWKERAIKDAELRKQSQTSNAENTTQNQSVPPPPPPPPPSSKEKTASAFPIATKTDNDIGKTKESIAESESRGTKTLSNIVASSSSTDDSTKVA
ncbi:DgyrCDS11054 [Dimorphilus gyrociliatus]|uniref:Phosphodiesterase n=1 Tax=Dimorphilus gyrociliatus TaxID=2664684 RepID=A0A7I8W252_9ANNE|nr:DgyrCDS11054 [Dimorphilus gyrociliatus]